MTDDEILKLAEEAILKLQETSRKEYLEILKRTINDYKNGPFDLDLDFFAQDYAEWLFG